MDKGIKLKLNFEHYKKSSICGLLIVAFISFIICVIVAAVAAPEIIGDSTMKYVPCDSSHRSLCFLKGHHNNTVFFHVDLEPYNQIFYLVADFTSKEELSQKMNYSLRITSRSGDDVKNITKKHEKMKLRCEDGNCDSEILFYIPYIEYETYTVMFTVFDEIPVDSMTFSIFFITEEFTVFFLGTKYFFLAISIINLVFFCIAMYQVGLRLWPRESFLVMSMGISLFIFNEPFLSLTLSKLTPGWSGVSVVCNTQFACMLLVFWFCILHNDMNPTYWLISFVSEIVLVFILFVLMNVVYMFTTIELKYDPTFSWEEDFPRQVRDIYIVIITLLVLFGIWIVVLIVRSLLTIGNKSLRQKFMNGSVVVMVLITFILIGVGAFQPIPRSGTLLLLTVSFYNIYFTVLLWILRPSKEAFNQYKEEVNKQPGDIGSTEAKKQDDLADYTINDDNQAKKYRI